MKFSVVDPDPYSATSLDPDPDSNADPDPDPGYSKRCLKCGQNNIFHGYFYIFDEFRPFSSLFRPNNYGL